LGKKIDLRLQGLISYYLSLTNLYFWSMWSIWKRMQSY